MFHKLILMLLNQNNQNPSSIDLPQPQTDPQSSSTTPPPEVPSQKSSKFILIGLILLIIAEVFGAGYYLIRIQNSKNISLQPQPTQVFLPQQQESKLIKDPTEDWKLYNDSRFNYTFRYPPDWQSSVLNPRVFEGETVKLGKGLYSPKYRLSADIQRADVPFQDFIKSRKESSGFYNITEERNNPISNVSSLWIKGQAESSFEGLVDQYWKINVFLKKDDLVGTLEFSSPAYPDDENIDIIFTQVLSTFKFIERNKDTGKLRVCPDMWVDQKSSMLKNGIASGEQIFLEINGILEPKDPNEFDLEWIKENCEIKEPDIVG
ncbi:hypothetical protein A2W14_04850 [Candidatus Gottesmanbacteria bacterium RBG_16_37_8]|uniref:Uncharacterized protein n=1 Tax=Candidatus Gottesmanbacteria bacterium RBG_16_37_8 TaxID=1798371 RepID=A0A1F5YUE2_9BACT|nr:MAG: hypothetical protein A2W14_04850 [Candidatus Gottesmanbacteria bacterium RBG_16_37_8]